LFMVPGGLVDPFLPALARHPGLKPIVAAHEGGAAYPASMTARMILPSLRQSRLSQSHRRLNRQPFEILVAEIFRPGA
jgi:hypothetical protein